MLEDTNLKDRMKEIYKHQKRRRRKGVLLSLVLYFLFIGIISIFLGNPLPHKESILFFEIWQYGWISTIFVGIMWGSRNCFFISRLRLYDLV